MAEWTGTGSNQSNYTGILTVTESSYSVENNTSTVTYSLVLRGRNSYYFQNWTLQASVSINGAVVGILNSKISMPSPSGGISQYTALTGTVTVPHNDDGTKSISCSAVMQTSTEKYYLPGTVSIPGGTLALTTIPRASSMTFSAFTFGTAGAITISRASSSFTHKIDYYFGNTSGEAVASTSSTSVSWAPALALLNQIPNSPSGTGTLRLYTYNGSTLIGTRDYTFTAEAGASIKPSCSFTFTDTSGCLATFGACVRSQSKLAVTTTGTQAYSSPITAYTVTVDGKSYSGASITTEAMSGTGTLTISVTVTDARGRTSAAATQQITVMDYFSPVVTLTAYRCTSGGTANPEGAYMRMTISAQLSSLNNQNSATFELKYKKAAEQSWTTLTGSGSSYTSAIIACDVASVYNIESTITDRLTSTPSATNIPVAFVLMDFYNTGKGIAFGKVATRDGFECNMNAEFSGQIEVDDDLSVGGDISAFGDIDTQANLTVAGSISVGGSLINDVVVEQGTSGIWTYRKWKSGIAECWGYANQTPSAMSSFNSAVWYFSPSFGLPADLFITAPCSYINADTLGGGLYWACSYYVDKNTINCRIMSGDSTARTVAVVLHAIGRWR